MKYYIFQLFLVFTVSLNAQWEIINEGDSNIGYINDIDFSDEKIGWIECDYEILLTNDGGNSWSSVQKIEPDGDFNWRTGPPPSITNAAFMNDSMGWYIYKDSLYQTRNGGNTWELLFESEISKIQTINDSIMIAANNDSLKKTIDSGKSWSTVKLGMSGELNDLFFINDEYGFVVFSRTDIDRLYFFRTTDGGENWKQMQYNDINNFAGYSGSRDLCFVDDSLGYNLVYDEYNYWDAVLYSTVDSGQTWTRLAEHVSSYSVPSPEEIFISVIEETNSKIFVSTNKGITWEEQYNKIAFIHDIYVNNDKRIFLIEGAVPDWVGSIGDIVVMNDYGFNIETWETIKISFPSLSLIKILDEKKWLIEGSEYGLHWGYSNQFITTDGGKNYVLSASSYSPPWWGVNDYYSFVGEKYGYYAKRPFLYKSENIGRSWNKLSDFCPESIYFISKDIGWASYDGAVFNTNDGGLSWNEELYNQRIMTIYFKDENNGWAVSEDCGNLSCILNLLKYNSNDGWTEIYELGNIRPLKINFISDEIGYILCEKEIGVNYTKQLFMRTMDGGYTWQEICDCGYYINDFAVFDDGTGWLVGQSNKKGVIIGFYYYGNQWYVETDDIISPLNSISVKDSLAVAVGENGFIIKTLDLPLKQAMGNSLSISGGKYLDKYLDTLSISAKVVNPENNSLDVYVLLENKSEMTKDSIILQDDGQFNDSIANDNIWCGYRSLTDLKEDMYSVKLFTVDNDFNTTHIYEDEESYFTTAGPVKVDTFSGESRNFNDNSDKFIKLHNLALFNHGVTKTLESVSAKIISNDTNIVTMGYTTQNYADIAPGESRISNSYFSLLVRNYVDSFYISFNIMSEGKLYWTDSTMVFISNLTDINEKNIQPTEFTLFQNYPNPFNPATRIQYNIPVAALSLPVRQAGRSAGTDDRIEVLVTLKIYDILGRELATLVNKKQKPGNYEVVWDAGNFASGIYFYRINCGDFIQTRKMVLLR